MNAIIERLIANGRAYSSSGRSAERVVDACRIAGLAVTVVRAGRGGWWLYLGAES